MISIMDKMSSRRRVPSGIGLRDAHHSEIMTLRPPVGWLEVHPENYLDRGIMREALLAVRAGWPVALHSVGLSLGSAAGIDRAHLERIANLAGDVEPMLVSAHLSWSIDGGTYLNDLLPVPLTEEALGVVAANVLRVQDRLKAPLLVENISYYARYASSDMSEPDFLAALARRTGCGLLLDVNNLYVNARNHGLDPFEFIDRLPADKVAELHLAGHSVNRHDGFAVHIDDHAGPVARDVWALFEIAVRRFPAAHPLVEWDNDLPTLDRLVAEAAAADLHRDLALERLDVA